MRGACAAKGDSVSSDGERAGAFGGSPGAGEETGRAAPQDPPADDAVEPAPAPAQRTPAAARRRVAPPTASLDHLPESTRALVGEAEELLRQVLSDDAEAAAAGDAAVREVRKEFAKLRREAGRSRRDDRLDDAARAVRAKRSAAVLRQVVSLLAQTVLADGRSAAELRWPVGVDVDAALAEVIRVLGTRSEPPKLPEDPAASEPPAEEPTP